MNKHYSAKRMAPSAERPVAKQVYHIGLIGTRKVDVVEAETPELACWSAGWVPAACDVVDITQNVRRLRACGDLQDLGPAASNSKRI